MDIRIISAKEISECRPVDEKRILFSKCESLTTNVGTRIVPFSRIYYYVYNVNKNVREEILPDIPKYAVADIAFAEKTCPYIYFFCLNFDNYPSGIFSLYRYSIKQGVCTEIYRYEDNLRNYVSKQRLRLFVLNDNYCIFQTEYLTEITEGESSYSGYFRFQSKLYDILAKTEYPIKETWMTGYGIQQMLPVVPNVCALRIGYSLLEDQNMNFLRGSSAPVEHIWLVTVSQLISDLLLGVTECTKEIIDHVHDTATLTPIKKMGKYLNYIRYQREAGIAEIIFYQYVTKEVLVLLDKNGLHNENPVKSCVLEHRPFIAKYSSKYLELMDIKTGNIALRLPKEYQIIDIIHDYIVLQIEKKGLLSSQKIFEIYQYPSLQRFYRVKAQTLQCISLTKDDINLMIT